MTIREAKCRCGALSALCSGEPVRNSVCHCLTCKRRSGSAFSWNATYPAAQIEVRGTFTTSERAGDEGRWVRDHFCPQCGSTVFYEISARPEMISVPVGGFADPDFPPPSFSVYDERKHGWFDFAPDLSMEHP